MSDPMLGFVKSLAPPRFAVAAAAAATAATTAGCGQVDRIVSDPVGQASTAARVAREAGRQAEHVVSDTIENASPAVTAAGDIAAAAARAGGYPIDLPGGRRVRVDLRKCIRMAGEGPYPATGNLPRPRTATQACATAAKVLLTAASPIPPQMAISALVRTADAGGLDLEGALNELDKEIR